MAPGKLITGTFTSSVDDFHVEEVPLYEPSGEGEHLYVHVRKRNLTTREVIRRAMEAFSVAERDVGYAGMKDKFATTRQTLSIRGVEPGDADALQGDGVEVLWAKKHRNKLRVGHLSSNRFRARIRDVGAGAKDHALALLKDLQAKGMLNIYGSQRFGRHAGNVDAAFAMMGESGRSRVKRWKQKLLISSLQSYLFNAYVEQRHVLGALGHVHTGDVLKKVGSGGVFTCEEAPVDQLRYDAFEVSITGPMFGSKMTAPAPDTLPASWELAVLEANSLTDEDFRRIGKLGPGTRRPLRAPVDDISVDIDGSDLWLGFQLPSGSYATVLIDQVVTKPVD